MGPYDELLQAADSLGFSLPSTSTDSCSSSKHVEHGLALARQAAEHGRQAHDLELRLSALSAHLAGRVAADHQQLQARLQGLGSVASTLQLISASKDAIADQLRSACLRPSIPVVPEYQQDFASMLRSAASNTEYLQNGLQVLQWAACLPDRPSCWEDQLRVIRDSAQAVKECVTAMQEFDQQLLLASSSNSG